jgi:uncharacterized protein (DUF2249 family)
MGNVIDLDVREVLPFERHERIFDAWHALPVGDEILLTNDHEPRPLFYQFQAEYPGEFEYSVEQRGERWWEARIKRIAEPKG